MKTIGLDQLGSIIDIRRDDMRVVTSGNACVPLETLAAFDALVREYRLNMLNAPPNLPDRDGVMLETAFVGPGMRTSPRLVYFPTRLSLVPLLFTRRLGIDVVIAHTSAPVDGKVSLGLEVNVIPAAIEACKARGGVVIAQVNPKMPYTFGDGEFPVDTFDAMIEVDTPVLTHAEPPHDLSAKAGGMARDESAQIIGRLISDQVSDGATLQMGIGDIPDAALVGLLAKKGLGIWTELMSDGVLALDRAGALDSSRTIVSSIVLGSQELYDWVHRNERIRLLRTETTNSPQIISQNPLMTSINTALQVDLFDQANASRIKTRIFSGFGGQTDFTVGAMHSAGGQAIMALRSWHPKANVSTIVKLLDEPVTSFQHSMVITEQGVAKMAGRDQRSQAVQLIHHAAHPQAVDYLWEEAQELGLA